MSKADKIFEELGYKIDIEVDYGLIRYNKEDKYFIRFIMEDKTVETNTIIDNQIYILDIDMKLLQAINEKVKELRMDMKKRAMKKWIPKGVYCYDFKKGKCKWWHYIGYKKYDRNNCEFANNCNEKECNCKTSIVKCDYLGIIDDENETLLWDSCKECGIKDE